MKNLFSVIVASGFVAANAFGANVTGTVHYKGAAPHEPVIRMSADPYCAKAHKTPVHKEDIVESNGKLADVFVYVKEGLTTKPAPATTPVEFDQTGCMYKPHVVGIEANQPFKIINSDSTLHNVHALPKQNPSFNMGMPTKGMTVEKKFAKPEMGIRVKCDVHGWMEAWVNVVDHPYFSVSGQDGNFTIQNLPPGTYTLEAWHHKLGTQTAKVTVPATGNAAPVEFTFGANKS